MSLALQSTRFGEIALDDGAAITFPSGLIGLPGRRWALVGEEGAFSWLHSLEDPDLALPVTRPTTFFPDYAVVLSATDALRIGVPDVAAADVFVTVRAAAELEGFRVNLRAPIVVFAGYGHQVLNEAPGLSVRTPLFGEADAPARARG